MKTKAHTFKTFPEFSNLTLSDRDAYNALIADFPPLTEYSFTNLMAWWGCFDGQGIGLLDDNIVLAYHILGNDEASGLCLLGTKKIDEAVCQIFDHLTQKGETPKLVHVPEFVVTAMRFPEMFSIKPERDYDECILSVDDFSDVSKLLPAKRSKTRRFLMEYPEESIKVEALDLSNRNVVEELLELVDAWEHMGKLNKLYTHERDSVYYALAHADELDIQGVALHAGGSLQSFLLYCVPSDSRYVQIFASRFNYDLPHIFEACVYMYAKWFKQEGYNYVNIDADIGNAFSRTLKISLGPTNFFRKYTIEPSN